MISLLINYSYYENVIQFIRNRGSNLRSPCDGIDGVIIKKQLFFIIWDDIFHIWGQIEAVFNISEFIMKIDNMDIKLMD